MPERVTNRNIRDFFSAGKGQSLLRRHELSLDQSRRVGVPVIGPVVHAFLRKSLGHVQPSLRTKLNIAAARLASQLIERENMQRKIMEGNHPVVLKKGRQRIGVLFALSQSGSGKTTIRINHLFPKNDRQPNPALTQIGRELEMELGVEAFHVNSLGIPVRRLNPE